jgi:hypothetical protein
MAQSINTSFYRGASRQQIAEALTPSLLLKSPDEVHGIRLTLEEHQRFLSPILLETDNERANEREVLHGDYALHLQHRQQSTK